jgi:hypothetical protein
VVNMKDKGICGYADDFGNCIYNSLGKALTRNLNILLESHAIIDLPEQAKRRWGNQA